MAKENKEGMYSEHGLKYFIEKTLGELLNSLPNGEILSDGSYKGFKEANKNNPLEGKLINPMNIFKVLDWLKEHKNMPYKPSQIAVALKLPETQVKAIFRTLKALKILNWVKIGA